MQSLIVELRAAEGGDDAKLLVMDQLRIYGKVCTLKGY
jgi:protein subunit release factor A